MLLTIGSRIRDNSRNTYILDDIIGSGGFGNVFRAHRESDGLVVAVKALQSSFESNDALLSFQREIMQTGLVSSDHVIKYYYAHDGNTYTEFPPYIIMEYADGGTLAELIAAQKKRGELFDISFIIDSCTQLASGMDEISKYLVHRDIKPENILIKDGKLKISDFGLSKLSGDSTRTLTFKGYGSMKYVAPEAWNNDKNTIQMDIYSMGIVFYELATLEYPYRVSAGADLFEYRNAHLCTPIKDLSSLNSSLPPSLVSVIIKMLEKPIQRRFTDWSSILSALAVQPLPKNDFGDALRTALGKRNKADILLQEETAKREKKKQELEDHRRLIRSQYESTIFTPIRDFIAQFNKQYAGNSRFSDLTQESVYTEERFFHTVSTPSGNRITIETEIIFAHNHQRKVPIDRIFRDSGYRTENYIPQCQGRDILAWSQISDEAGHGFNLILLKAAESLYGDWYVLHNTNSALGRSSRTEPFGFSISELPKEITYINTLHIYDSKLTAFQTSDLLNFLADYA